MANITPVAYKPSGTIPGTTKIGNLIIGTTEQDYSGLGEQYGTTFWSTPNQDLGYVIAHEDTTGGHNGNTITGGTPAYVGFWQSEFLTENSFVDLANTLFNQSFTGGSEANTWLNLNGYWSSYVDNYRYEPNILLSWPSSTTGYSLYGGGFTSPDDGYSNVALPMPTTFVINGFSSNNFYLSTNGYFTIGLGASNIINSPQQLSYPAPMAGNPGDNWLQPGLMMGDGDIQNWYYKTGDDGGGKYFVKNIIYSGNYGAASTPSSYLINFYRDNNYEWLETRVKSNTRGNVGPYNSTDVSQGASTTSRVWRGDLNGQNWVYMGTGSVQQ